jgi:hypothetical protein
MARGVSFHPIRDPPCRLWGHNLPPRSAPACLLPPRTLPCSPRPKRRASATGLEVPAASGSATAGCRPLLRKGRTPADWSGARRGEDVGQNARSLKPLAREREPIERVRARLEALIRANAAPRCGARSKRTGKPCRAAAMPNGRCKIHGGKSTGPRTPEGLERSRRANWKHGYYSREAKAERSRVRVGRLLLRYLRTLP